METNYEKSTTHIPFIGYTKAAYIIKLQAEKGTGTYKFINH